ncbi:hypothetical protein Tco_0623197 [Tanacetum coccineum]
MSSIYDVKYSLTQTALDAFYQKCHIPDVVHPELPTPNQSIHDSPVGKIGVYTRFFDFANFRIPLSQFLVDVLEYFRINLSQLSVITFAKVSHFEILCRVHGYALTVGFFQMDLFAFIRHADPTKVRIVERQIEEGQVSLLESIEGRVIPLAGGDEQGGQNDNVDVAGPHDLNEEGGGAEVGDQTEESDRVVQDEEVNIVVDEDVQVVVADKPKGTRRKRKAIGGVSGSNLPPKKLREYHGTFGDAGASTAGKSIAVLQDLLDRSTLAVEVGVTAATTHPAKRFVISSDSSHHYSTNGADVEVTSIVRSSILPPPVMIAIVAATAVAGTSSALVLGAGTEPVIQSLFTDSTSPSVMNSETLQQIYVPKWNMINDSALDNPEVCHDMIDQLAPLGFFSQLHDMDYDQLFAEFNVGAARQMWLSAEVRLRSEHNFRERKKFERKCNRQADLLKEKDDKIASLKASFNELNNLKERNLTLEGEKSTLEGQVAMLESAAASKDIELASVNTQVAKLNHDLSSLQLSCDELSIKAASLESQKDSLTDHDEQELMGMAVHLDEEFYPRFMTTIAGWRWIINIGFRLTVMKCIQSLEYVVALGTAIGLAIDKGMQTGLVAGIDHGKAKRGLAEVAAYDPSVKDRYVSFFLALRDLDFNFLSQLES